MPHYDEGIYACQITAQGLNKSSKKATPGFFLRVQPEGGAYERDIQWWITTGTVEYVVRDLKSLGFNGKSFGELDPRREGFYNFVGATIKAACTHEVNGEKTYERWELPFGGADLQPLDAAEAQQLDSLFGNQLRADGSSEYSAPAPAAQAPWDVDAAKELQRQIDKFTPQADDSIPF